MTNSFDKIKQLEILLQRYPHDDVDYEGIILDYLGETNKTIDSVFEINLDIYKEIFCKEKEKPIAKKLLASTVIDQESFDKLYKNCENLFPVIPIMLDELKGEALPIGRSPVLEPDEIAGFPVKITIWQLSDIHFGQLNVFENDPTELAATLSQASSEFKILPDLILVSGDLTSSAEEKDFEKFLTFTKALSKSLWGQLRPGRFLVIPGNHDISWLEDGTADKLDKFRTIFEGQDVCITPFGEKKEVLEDGAVQVNRYSNEIEEIPPFALVSYPKIGFEVLLLVSSYYSGEVPEKVRQILSGIEEGSNIKKRLIELLREDKGSINRKYLANLAENLPSTEVSRIGLIHHNTCQIGTESCANVLAPGLLDTLFKKNIRLLFHGHVHQIEDPSSSRPVLNNKTYPVPCTSLTSHCHMYNRGFSIHFVGGDNNRTIATYGWQLSSSGLFNANHFSFLYKFMWDKDKLELEYGRLVY